jgi:hypothetical protein
MSENERYLWPVTLTQMYKQVSIKICNINDDYMAFITEDSIIFNRNYKFLESLPDNPTANKLGAVTSHLTDIVRSYLAGKVDWQDVEESLRRFAI